MSQNDEQLKGNPHTSNMSQMMKNFSVTCPTYEQFKGKMSQNDEQLDGNMSQNDKQLKGNMSQMMNNLSVTCPK